MKPNELILHCYALKDGSQWVALCLDFDLAAQGDTFEEARQCLDEQIRSYVEDALIGEDREHAPALLSRKAPLSEWVKYWFLLAKVRFLHWQSGMFQPFTDTLPMKPA